MVDLNGTDRAAPCVSAGGERVTFRYTIQAGDNRVDLDLLYTSIAMNGGAIKDSTGRAVNPALSGISSSAFLKAKKNINIDTAPPSIESFAITGQMTMDNYTNVWTKSVSVNLTIVDNISGLTTTPKTIVQPSAPTYSGTWNHVDYGGWAPMPIATGVGGSMTSFFFGTRGAFSAIHSLSVGESISITVQEYSVYDKAGNKLTVESRTFSENYPQPISF